MKPTTIYGNPAAKAAIEAATRGGRLSHAYLFYGEQGTGKRSMVNLFTQSLLCTEGAEPCGTCSACRKLAAHAHPDVTVLDGAADSIKVDDIRRCKIDAQIRPNESPYRIFWLLDIDRMTNGAANALLKLLEEPPAYALFLLTVQNKDACPATVVSRCLSVPCTPPGIPLCVQALQEQCPDASEEAIKQAAEDANGNIGRAITLLNAADSEEARRYRAICDALEQKKELPLLLAFAEYEAAAKKTKKTASTFSLACRRLADRAAAAAVCKAKRQSGPLGGYTLAQLLRMETLFRTAERRLAGNANPSLIAAWLPAMLIQSSTEERRNV